MLYARVAAVFPGELRGYRETSDGWIPHGLFWVLVEHLEAVNAMQRTNLTTSVALGAGLAMSGSDEVKCLADADIRRAFPEG